MQPHLAKHFHELLLIATKLMRASIALQPAPVASCAELEQQATAVLSSGTAQANELTGATMK